MRKLFAIASLSLVAVAGGCTNTQWAHLTSYGTDARVTCFSGGVVVLDDFSDGKVANAGNSDGYEFKSITTGRLAQFSGTCGVDYGAVKPVGWKAKLP